ncbi:hypothetical protein [Petralouisia muris]|uniref:hypothetical protein n=1 Tax=Petralouisia muris TaxID=3032872 RepID=UPI0023B87FC5|nr:hypothetical protein [Petralouisia muris]
MEQGEAVSAYEWDGCGNSCACPACIIGVYRKGLAVNITGQLYTKRQFGEVCGKRKNFHKGTGKTGRPE